MNTPGEPGALRSQHLALAIDPDDHQILVTSLTTPLVTNPAPEINLKRFNNYRDCAAEPSPSLVVGQSIILYYVLERHAHLQPSEYRIVVIFERDLALVAAVVVVRNNEIESTKRANCSFVMTKGGGAYEGTADLFAILRFILSA